MKPIQLRDYQQASLDQIRQEFRQGNRRVCLIGATGYGKTEVAASIMQHTARKGNRVIFLADRVVLVRQTSHRLRQSGIRHGVIQGDNSFDRHEAILVCSQQTLEKRGWMDHADLIVVDECHTERKKMLEMVRHSNKHVIGLTATPFSPGMPDFYQAVVTGASTRMLQDRGWLVPIKPYIAKQIDVSKLRLANGEYTAKSASDAAKGIVADIVTEWERGCQREFGGAVKTLVYVPTVDYGQILAARFDKAGYVFRQVSYRNTAEQNARAIAELTMGNCHGLISVDALVKGLDVPEVQCLVVARKYSASLTNHIQLLGRGMRACPEIGKTYCLVHDHVGNMVRFAAEAEPFWESGQWDLAMNRAKKPDRDKKEKEARERICVACGHVMGKWSEHCPACGAEQPKRKPRTVQVHKGEMVEYSNRIHGIAKKYSKAKIWKVLSTYAIERKGMEESQLQKAERLAKALYRDMTGSWPPWGSELDLEHHREPDIELLANRQIRKYAKRMRRERRRAS